jgi:adenylate kinase family enzyme
MDSLLQSPIRIVVVGTSSTGKTTFASRLAKRLAVPLVELDELYWSRDWQPKSKAEFIELVERSIRKPKWIVDGNYSLVREHIWSKATMVIWLNYSFPLAFWRGFKRALGRCITRHTLWHGNRETFRQTFFSKQSILVWIITTHRRRRIEFATIRKSNQFPNVSWIEFRHPSQAEQWLQQVHSAA